MPPSQTLTEHVLTKVLYVLTVVNREGVRVPVETSDSLVETLKSARLYEGDSKPAQQPYNYAPLIQPYKLTFRADKTAEAVPSGFPMDLHFNEVRQ